jgi:hypothetical protein
MNYLRGNLFWTLTRLTDLHNVMADSTTIVSNVNTSSNISSNLTSGANVSSNIISSTVHTSDVAPAGPPGMIQSVQAGSNIDIDSSNPNSPIISLETLEVADLPTGIPATNLGDGSISNTEFQYLNNVSSNLQTQLDAKQPLDTQLTELAALNPSNDDFIQEKGGVLTNRTPAQAKTDLALVKGDVGLGNVDNTSDATKNAASVTLTNKTIASPIITTAIYLPVDTQFFGSSSGHTVLSASAVASGTLTLPATTDTLVGKATTDTLTNKTLTSPVINTPTGIVKGDVGLGNVDNTSDANKPVSTATQTALNLKAPLASPTFTGTVTLPTGLTGVLRADSGVVSTDSDVTDLVSVASDTVAGKVELATTAETTTGTDATRAVTPDGLHDMTSLSGAAWFLDEDDFASDSATKVASQQSTKAYITSQIIASGSGDVVGPSSATDNAIARFDLTTGKLIQNSVVTIADTTGNMAGVGTINTLTLPASNFVGLTDSQTLTNKTLTAPTIADFTNAQHDHGDADDGGVIVWQGLPAGALVQVVSTVPTAVATGTTTIPYDDTIPQITEGIEFMTLAITPKATSHILVIQVIAWLANSAANNMGMALFQDATANALAAAHGTLTVGDAVLPISLTYTMTAGTTSSTTFRIRAGGSLAGTTTFNGAGGARKYGAISKSSIVIYEYKA